MRKVNILQAFSSDSPGLRNLSLAVVLFATFLLIVTWTGFYQAFEGEKEEDLSTTYRDTANLARAFEEHTLRTLRAADQTALFLKVQYEHEGRSFDIPRYIREGRLPGEPFNLLGVADEHGEVAVSSQVPFVKSNIGDREHFRVHRDYDSERVFVSKPVYGRASGRWSIQMTRRVNKPDGSFGGVVVVSVDPYYFSEFYKQVDLGRNASVYLVGRDGIVRARQSGANIAAGQDITGDPVLEMMLLNDSGQYRATSRVDGITRLNSYRALHAYPLAVVVGVEEAAVLESLRERMDRYYPVIGMINFGIVVAMLMLLKFIARQKENEADLRQARELLEARVEQRTQELSALNEELTAMNQEHVAMNEELNTTNQELWNEVAERRRAEDQLRRKNEELVNAYSEVKTIQVQAFQQDKMASIGQLAAGVAHEINNPMAFIISNLESLRDYLGRLTRYIALQDETVTGLVDGRKKSGRDAAATLVSRVADARQSLKIDYVIHDVESLISETMEGATRVKDIVQDLKGFARVESENKPANINDGLESAINIVWNEMKYKAALEKDFGELPLTKCNIGQLNQVFMNILMNAAQAIDKWGEIRVKTWVEGGDIFVSIADTGCGISPQILNRIYEPFFTTKEVGKGTGLGLSVSYDIVKKHGGYIAVDSEPGKGTTFTICIPVVT
ncbi:MAG TPA: ATP-binding protein [Negativicutes bacterium]|nr:ATP-binding protein [Negativicutes bacterium]